MPTTAEAAPDAPRASRRSHERRARRSRLVQDDTGVRSREHAAQDRYLLDIVERLLAA